MQNHSWQRLTWASSALTILNVAVLGTLWLAPMPPKQLPHNHPEVLPHAPNKKDVSKTEASVYAATDIVSLDKVLAGRLVKVAREQGVPLETVAPDPLIREAALSAVDPQSSEALALLESYAVAFAALDPNATP